MSLSTNVNEKAALISAIAHEEVPVQIACKLEQRERQLRGTGSSKEADMR